MSKEKRRVPKLRFPGFTEDWEPCEFKNLFKKNLEKNNGKFKSDKTISIAKMTFNELGNGASEESLDNYKVLRIGDVAFEGHENKDFKFGRFVMNDIGNGIMSPRFTTLRPIELLELDFWKEYINYESIMQKKLVHSTKKGTMMHELVVDEFLKQEILVPPEKEQQHIGCLLKFLSKVISLQQRKLEHLNLKKKALLQKLFPKEGSRYPELRFPGFTDAWEQRKFSDLYEKISEKNDLSYSLDKIISVANMYYKSDAKVSNEEYLKTYNIFRYGEIAFEGNMSKDFAYGRFVENTIGDGIISHVFEVFRPITKYDIYFWKYYINYEPIMGKVLSRCTKKTTMMTNLVTKDFLKETVLVPTLAEQKQIGIFLNTLDQFITLHQRKLEHLRIQKKSLLQQLFV